MGYNVQCALSMKGASILSDKLGGVRTRLGTLSQVRPCVIWMLGAAGAISIGGVGGGGSNLSGRGAVSRGTCRQASRGVKRAHSCSGSLSCTVVVGAVQMGRIMLGRGMVVMIKLLLLLPALVLRVRTVVSESTTLAMLCKLLLLLLLPLLSFLLLASLVSIVQAILARPVVLLLLVLLLRLLSVGWEVLMMMAA